MLPRKRPKLKRKAMVKSNTEIAQGLTLSTNAAINTRGRSNCPPCDKFQIKEVEEVELKYNIPNPKSAAREISTISLFMLRGNGSRKTQSYFLVFSDY